MCSWLMAGSPCCYAWYLLATALNRYRCIGRSVGIMDPGIIGETSGRNGRNGRNRYFWGFHHSARRLQAWPSLQEDCSMLPLVRPLVHDSIARHQPLRDHCSISPLPRTFHRRTHPAVPGAQPRISATTSALEPAVRSSSTRSSQRAALALQRQPAGSLEHFGQAFAERGGMYISVRLSEVFSFLFAETTGRSAFCQVVDHYCLLLF